ncbi:MAG: hypothetical protein GY862_08500 [Gammaproteobacteria bacterium]|nr:hypothetical protein [Gammaproteobacteria bacterium]
MKNGVQRLLRIIIGAAFLCIAVVAAHAQEETAQTTNSASLAVVSGCPALLTKLKEAAIQNMEQRVDAGLRDALQWFKVLGACRPPSGSYFGYGINDCQLCSPVVSEVPLYRPSPEAASEYSETNVQVAGVDEADFVKNDGSYIYILANGKFRIVDAWPPEEAVEVSAFDIEGEPKKMFVHDGRAFIYSSLYRLGEASVYYFDANTECTYGYDCEFTGDGHALKITVLDISDVTMPRLVREMHFSGSYLNARRIGNAVHSALVFPKPNIAGVVHWPGKYVRGALCDMGTGLSADDIITIFKPLKAENRVRIAAAEDIDGWVPSVKDIRYSGDVPVENTAPLEGCNNFYLSEQKDGRNLLSIVSTDANGEAPLRAATIIGKPGAVYASDSALYVAAGHARNSVQSPWFFPDGADIAEASTIYKFSLRSNPPAALYTAAGAVKGRVLNQFSMDEFQGFLRIATTTGRLPNPNTYSTLSVLEEKAGRLTITGLVDNIAPTEDIRSARFMGNRGYVVTFKKTDPLFVFDLSDPYQPVIAGELKIPGFSTYMHRLDGTHLLTIGYDADDQGSFAWFKGIMLQIFDVSDMANPLLTHKEVIGTRGSTSEAATNHLAFNYFASKGLLAIPMTICEEGEYSTSSGGRYGNIMAFGGLLVYGVDAETGFELRGGVSHVAPESRDNFRYACSNWWTDSNSYVQRSIFMDDYVFSITENAIKANRLSAMGIDAAAVYLTDQPQCDSAHADRCLTEADCQAVNAEWQANSCRLPLYPPLRSSNAFVDLCTARYDPSAGILNIPCLEQAGTQYKMSFSLSLSSSPLLLTLVSSEAAKVKTVSGWCEAVYELSQRSVHVPCIIQTGTAAVYQADFTVLAPFTMELTNFAVVR